MVQQSVYNLFHVGQMQRLMELDPGPLYHVLGEGRLAPDTTPKPWWNERPDVDEKFIPLSRYRERKWFEQLLRSAPSTWPRRPGFELVMATMHGQNRFVQGYNATLAANGLIGGEKLLVASADAELRRQLNDISLWQDHIHLENTGAVVYTRWLSAQLLPMLSELKQQAPTVEVRH